MRNLFRHLGLVRDIQGHRRKQRRIASGARGNGIHPERLEPRMLLAVDVFASTPLDGRENWVNVIVDNGDDAFIQHVGNNDQDMMVANNSSFVGAEEVPNFLSTYDSLNIFEGRNLVRTNLQRQNAPYQNQFSQDTFTFYLPREAIDLDSETSGVLRVGETQYAFSNGTDGGIEFDSPNLIAGGPIVATVITDYDEGLRLNDEEAITRLDLRHPAFRGLQAGVDVRIEQISGTMPQSGGTFTDFNLLASSVDAVQRIQAFEQSEWEAGQYLPGSLRGSLTIDFLNVSQIVPFQVDTTDISTDDSNLGRTLINLSFEDIFAPGIERNLDQRFEVLGTSIGGTLAIETASLSLQGTFDSISGELRFVTELLRDETSDLGSGVPMGVALTVNSLEAGLYTPAAIRVPSNATIFPGLTHTNGLQINLPTPGGRIRIDSPVITTGTQFGQGDVLLASSEILINAPVLAAETFEVPSPGNSYLDTTSERFVVNAPVSSDAFTIQLADATETAEIPRSQLIVTQSGSLSNTANLLDGPPANLTEATSAFIEVKDGDIYIEGTVSAGSQSYVMSSSIGSEAEAPYILTTRSRLTDVDVGLLSGDTLSLTLGNDTLGENYLSIATSEVFLSTDVTRLRTQSSSRLGDPLEEMFPYVMTINEANDLVIDAVAGSSETLSVTAGGSLSLLGSIRSQADVVLESVADFQVSAPITTSFGSVTMRGPSVVVDSAVRVLDAIQDERLIDILIEATDPTGGMVLNDAISGLNRIQLNSAGGVTGDARVRADVVDVNAQGDVSFFTAANLVTVDAAGTVRVEDESAVAFEVRESNDVTLVSMGADRLVDHDNDASTPDRLSPALYADVFDTTEIVASAPNGSVDVLHHGSQQILIGDLADINAGVEVTPGSTSMLAAGSAIIRSTLSPSMTVRDFPAALSSAKQVRIATTKPLPAGASYTPGAGEPGTYATILRFNLAYDNEDLPDPVTGERNGVIDPIEIDLGNGVLDPGEDLNGNGKLDTEDNLIGNGVLDIEDTNGNGVLDTEDTNGNGVLDPGEDLNENGVLDTEDLNGNGELDIEDANGNGVLDTEDKPDGVRRPSEDLDGDRELDQEDTNGNGELDPGEDKNGNGFLDMEDTNGNGILDLSDDRNGNGVFDPSEDRGNGVLDTEDTNGNGVLDPGEDLNNNGFLDTEDTNGDGELTREPGRIDEDLGNGVLDDRGKRLPVFDNIYANRMRIGDRILVKNGQYENEEDEIWGRTQNVDNTVNGIYVVLGINYISSDKVEFTLARSTASDETSELKDRHYVTVTGVADPNNLAADANTLAGKSFASGSFENVSPFDYNIPSEQLSVGGTPATPLEVNRVPSRPGYVVARAATSQEILVEAAFSEATSPETDDASPYIDTITARSNGFIDQSASLFNGVPLEKNDIVLVREPVAEAISGEEVGAPTDSAIGLYSVKDVGSASSRWSLERYQGIDEDGDGTIDQVVEGVVAVAEGSLRTALTGQMFELSYRSLHEFGLPYVGLTDYKETLSGALQPENPAAYVVGDIQEYDSESQFRTDIGTSNPNGTVNFEVSTEGGTNTSPGSLGRMLDVLQSNSAYIARTGDRQPYTTTFNDSVTNIVLEQQLPVISTPVSLKATSLISIDGSEITQTRDGAIVPTGTITAAIGPVRPSQERITRRLVRSSSVSGAFLNGIELTPSAQGSVISNLQIGGFNTGAAIFVGGAKNVLIDNVVLGRDLNGPLPNRYGVLVENVMADGPGSGSSTDFTTISNSQIYSSSDSGILLGSNANNVRIVDGNIIGTINEGNAVGVKFDSVGGRNILGAALIGDPVVGVQAVARSTKLLLPVLMVDGKPTINTDDLFLGQTLTSSDGATIASGTVITAIEERFQDDDLVGIEITLSQELTNTANISVSLDPPVARNAIQYNSDGVVLETGSSRIVMTDVTRSVFDGIVINGVGTSKVTPTGQHQIGGVEYAGVTGENIQNLYNNAIHSNGLAGIAFKDAFFKLLAIDEPGKLEMVNAIKIQGNYLGTDTNQSSGLTNGRDGASNIVLQPAFDEFNMDTHEEIRKRLLVDATPNDSDPRDGNLYYTARYRAEDNLGSDPDLISREKLDNEGNYHVSGDPISGPGNPSDPSDPEDPRGPSAPPTIR